MLSFYAVGLVAVSSLLLIFCGDDDDGKKGGSGSEHTLKIGGIGTHVTTSTELKVTAEIMHDTSLVDKGDVASSKVTLTIKCGDNQVAEQKGKAAEAGKVVFDTIRVEGEHFTGSCTAFVHTKIANKDVRAEYKFNVGTEEDAGNNKLAACPSDKPTLPAQLVIGESLDITSTVTLKVQPNNMCDGSVALIYYDAVHNEVREVLTAGEVIKPISGKVSGLAIVQVESTLACKDVPPSVNLAVSPCFEGGETIAVAGAPNAPSLDEANFSDDNGKIKLSWSGAQNFSGGAEVFFNNAAEGNEWTRHSDGALQWHNNSNVTSMLDYTLPVRALVKVAYSGGEVHWLYFKRDS